MKISIGHKPLFYLPLTIRQVGVVIALSRNHYDGQCRSASASGTANALDTGFLIGWKDHLQFCLDNPLEGGEHGDAPVVQANFHQIDLFLKILEATPQLQGEDRTIAENLAKDLYAALRLSQETRKKWHCEVDTDSIERIFE